MNTKEILNILVEELTNQMNEMLQMAADLEVKGGLEESEDAGKWATFLGTIALAIKATAKRLP